MSKGIITLLIIAAVLGIILLLRLGINCAYRQKILTVHIQVGFAYFKVYSSDKKRRSKAKKTKKKEKEKTKQPKEDQKTATRQKMSLSGITELVTRLSKPIKRTLKRIRIDDLCAYVTLCADEPDKLAILYGSLNAALGTVHALLDNMLNMKNFDVRLEPDFCGSKTQAEGRLHITARVITLICAVIGLTAAYIQYTRKNKIADEKQRGGGNERGEEAHSQRSNGPDYGKDQGNG